MVSRPGKPIDLFGAYDRQFVLHDIVVIGEDDQVIAVPPYRWNDETIASKKSYPCSNSLSLFVVDSGVVSSTHPEGVKIRSDESERVLRGNSKMVQRRRLRREGDSCPQ
jgi:hypothetical protein